MSARQKQALTIAADLFTGMPKAAVLDTHGAPVHLEPTVSLKKDEHFRVQLNPSESLTKRLASEVKAGKVSISLGSLDLDLQHNQSFGMVQASTGCISNPGGPGC
jgi:hypothetical protein